MVQEFDGILVVPAPTLEAPERSAPLTLAEDVIFNDLLTTYYSKLVPTKGFSRFALYLFIDSTGAPTDIRFQVHFTRAPQEPYYEYRQGPFASLFYEDADTASGLADVFNGDVVGDFLGVRIVATGTTSTLLFQVTVGLQLFK